MPIIYQLADLTAADFETNGFTFPNFYWSSTWDGTDPPNTDYPEFGQFENIHRAENAGASGQHVLDAIDTGDYSISWITLCGVGNLANGQFDCRGGGPGFPLKCRWQQFFRSSALAEAGYSVPLVLARGDTNGEGPGLLGVETFLLIEMYQDAGTDFQWNIRYDAPGGKIDVNSGLTGYPGVSDDAEHQMIVTMVPSTVTGAYAGDGSMGGATVASDGSIDLAVDGVSVISASGLQFVINRTATTNPAVYYGKTIWHGD